MAEERTSIVQIRKKGGLDSIVRDKSGNKIRPMLYSSDNKNHNLDGTLEGEYRGQTILDTKHFIAPMWNDIKKRWSFGGGAQDLVRLIDKMKLRYPKGHPKEGTLVKPGTDAGERLHNRQDDVFNHPDFYGKYYMENGRVSLDLADPKQEFLYLCYKGDTSVRDRSSKEVVSKYVAAGAKYELVSPQAETKKARASADKEVRAIQLLANMGANEEKMRSIALIMELPQYSKTTDVNGLFLLLKDTAAQNSTISAKYGKTYQDRFIELAEMKDEDLQVNGQVMKAKKTGIIRKRRDHYLFNGARIDGITNDVQLMGYFKNPKNQEDYIKLIELLEDGN